MTEFMMTHACINYYKYNWRTVLVIWTFQNTNENYKKSFIASNLKARHTHQCRGDLRDSNRIANFSRSGGMKSAVRSMTQGLQTRTFTLFWTVTGLKNMHYWCPGISSSTCLGGVDELGSTMSARTLGIDEMWRVIRIHHVGVDIPRIVGIFWGGWWCFLATHLRIRVIKYYLYNCLWTSNKLYNWYDGNFIVLIHLLHEHPQILICKMFMDSPIAKLSEW